MADLEQHENRPYERGTSGFVPWLMPLMFLAPTALAAVWLGGSLGGALVGGGWNPPPVALDSLYDLVRGGTHALWPGTPTGAVVAGIAALAGVLFGVAALGFFAADPVLASVSSRRAARTAAPVDGADGPRQPAPGRGPQDAFRPAEQGARVSGPERTPGNRSPVASVS
ncbi:hypothetical protein ACIODW_16610 [Streptomyces sp. NPDC087897]|uniref:hypothetical protein n=1 Tax=Streptomyces sp. NPDC087897 TaxID=3365817 RepID=UPI0037FDD733